MENPEAPTAAAQQPQLSSYREAFSQAFGSQLWGMEMEKKNQESTKSNDEGSLQWSCTVKLDPIGYKSRKNRQKRGLKRGINGWYLPGRALWDKLVEFDQIQIFPNWWLRSK